MFSARQCPEQTVHSAKGGAKIMIFAETGKPATKTVQNRSDTGKDAGKRSHITSPETSLPPARASLICVEDRFTGGMSMRRMR